MDGNGRWAKARRHNRIYGHIRGAKVAKNVIDECVALGIQNLTLFAFLMFLLRRQLQREGKKLVEKNVRFQCIGDLARLPEPVRFTVQKVIEETSQNTGMKLTFALSYGGRQEITEMAREVARQVQLGLLEEKEVDEALVASLLPSSFLPDPDLIIRTSGESRLSNFFLWQSAYSEIAFEQKAWPDFTNSDLLRILSSYSLRERRFGRTTDQVRPAPPSHGG
jgi:undecaprenyl diphosphate synthase